VTKYYEELEWPSLPEELLSSLVRWGLTADRAVPASGRPSFSLLQTPWSLREWVKENVPVEIDEGWMVTLQRFDTMHAGFHVDSLRDWSYNCVIYGDAGITEFKPSFDSDEVTSVKYKKNRWYYHKSSVPHAVRAIPATRLAVTVFKFLPHRLRVNRHFNSTAPQLAEEYVKDPYFYYS
jgi:hypothetical protein